MPTKSRTIGLIAATNEEWVLGKTNGSIPWKHTGDQKLFAETTKDSVVIMGRVTWEGIPEKYRPLRDRLNVIISKTMLENPFSGGAALPTVWIYRTVREAMEDLQNMGTAKDIWFIGGRKIYEEGLSYCNTVHLTMVPDEIPAADNIVYMPDNVRAVVGWRAMTREHPYNEHLMLCQYEPS